MLSRQSLLGLSALFTTLFLSLVFTTELHAQTQKHLLSTRVGVEIGNWTIHEVLDQVRESSDISFTYTRDQLDLDQKVQIQKKSYVLNNLLYYIFDDQPIIPKVGSSKNVILTFDREKYAAIKLLNSKRTISGVVKDKETGEPLIGAYIYDNKRRRTITSNELGLFQMEVDMRADSLVISYIGYATYKLPTKSFSDEPKEVSLKPDIELDEVLIVSKLPQEESTENGLNHYLDRDNVDLGVRTIGDYDPMKALMQLPSIQSGHEGQGNIYIRGGSPDQNLILMDGVPLYETNHILGISSIFNIDAIKNVQLYKQAYPAKYGGRLSSVIDFQLKEGNAYDHEFSMNFSPLSLRLHAEGPINYGKTSYNFSLRNSLVNIFFNDAYEDLLDFDDTDIRYYDFNGKITHAFSPSSKLQLSAYTGNDLVRLDKNERLSDGLGQFNIANSDQIEWGNQILSAQWSQIFSNNFTGKMKLLYSKYEYGSRSAFDFALDGPTGVDSSSLDILSSSDIEDRGAIAEFDYFLNNENKLSFGGGVLFHKFKPSIIQSRIALRDDLSTYNDSITPYDVSEVYAYIEDQIDLPNRTRVNMGLRVSSFGVGEERYTSFEPRFSIVQRLASRHVISLSTTQMYQLVHLLVNPGIGLPSQLWVPSTENLPPERALQVSFSYRYNVAADVKFEFGIYSKEMKNVLEYESPFDLFYTFINDERAETNFARNQDWEKFAKSGEGISRGAEISLRKEAGKFKWNLGYSLSKTNRTFEDLNNGQPFPYKYDRRNDISVYGKYHINEKLSVHSSWVYGTGDWFSLATEEYSLDGVKFLQSDGRNTFQLKAYHRLDMGMEYKSKLSRGSDLNIDLGIFNVYNRKNWYYVLLYRNPLTDTFERREVSIFPIIPHFNIYVTF